MSATSKDIFKQKSQGDSSRFAEDHKDIHKNTGKSSGRYQRYQCDSNSGNQTSNAMNLEEDGFTGEAAGVASQSTGRNDSAVGGAATREEMREVTLSKQGAGEEISTVNPATAQATVDHSQHYDIQMDQFQVIDSKDKASTAQQSPHIVQQTDKPKSEDKSEQKLLTQQESSEFFLTGVNVQNQDIEKYAIEAAPQTDEQPESPKSERIDAASPKDLLVDQEISAQVIDRYKLLAVVDSGRSFSNNECVYVNLNKNEICHLSVDSHTSIRFDELVQSYEQVFKIGRSMAHTFMTRRNTNKVILNVADQFSTNNNCGFNLANFKLKFLKNYFREVISDYERSFIGSFAREVLETYMPNTAKDQFELFFSIAKFEGNMGYSLTQNQSLEEIKIDDNFGGADDQVTQTTKKQQQILSSNPEHQTLEQQMNTDTNDLGEQTPQQLQAKGLQDSNPSNGQQQRQEENESATQIVQKQPSGKSKLAKERRQEILKTGSIPEFVPITDSLDFYKVLQAANHRNKLLVESQRQQYIESLLRGEQPTGSEQSSKQTPPIDLNEDINLKNIKDDVVMIQFKLVRKDNMKLVNTQTFINLPTNKLNDINISTLIEIVHKQNQSKTAGSNRNKQTVQQSAQQFLPYNKSILTRILYPSLSKSNLLVVNHYSKRTILRHLRQPVTGYQTGPAKGLFTGLFRLGYDVLNKIKKRKLQQREALQILERAFKSDLASIYSEISGFREGIKSFEVYTRQTATQMANQGNVRGAQQPQTTMFHQMLHFLVLQEEMQADAEVFCNNQQQKSSPQKDAGVVSQTNPSNFFPSLLPEEEIQKVIFDSAYLDFIQKKQQEQHGLPPQLSTAAQEHPYEANDGPIHANTSIKAAAQLARESQIPQLRTRQQAELDKEKKLHFVQYEYVKSELKEEYDKRVGFLHKRLNKKAQMDPSFLLLNSMSAVTSEDQLITGSISTSQAFLDPVDLSRPGFERAKQLGQQIQLQKKILGGPQQSQNNLAQNRNKGSQRGGAMARSKTGGAPNLLQKRAGTRGVATVDDYRDVDVTQGSKEKKSNRKDDYYKFYLDNAQKAIDLMIEQHRSHGNLFAQQQQQMQPTTNQNRENSGQQSEDEQQAILLQQNLNKDGSSFSHSGDGMMISNTNVGYQFNTNKVIKKKNDNIMRSNSTMHSGKLLEPLVQRHQKINRLTINSNQQKRFNDAGCYESQNVLEKIDESYNNKKKDKGVTTSGQISMNNRRSKPYSANQQKNKIVSSRIKNTMLAVGTGSSTHYTSNNLATATNNGAQQQLLMNQTMVSSVDSGPQATGIHMSKINAIKSSDRGDDQVMTQQDRRPVTSNVVNEYDLDNDQSQTLLYNQPHISLQPPRISTTEGLNSSGQRLVYRLNDVATQKQGQEPPSGATKLTAATTSYSQGMYKQNQSKSAISKSFNLGATSQQKRAVGQLSTKGILSIPSKQKRILTNLRPGLRGELLASGYKSLRAQGMLRATDVGSSMDKNMGKRQHSGNNLPQNVNICIEKRDAQNSQNNDAAYGVRGTTQEDANAHSHNSSTKKKYFRRSSHDDKSISPGKVNIVRCSVEVSKTDKQQQKVEQSATNEQVSLEKKKFSQKVTSSKDNQIEMPKVLNSGLQSNDGRQSRQEASSAIKNDIKNSYSSGQQWHLSSTVTTNPIKAQTHIGEQRQNQSMSSINGQEISVTNTNQRFSQSSSVLNDAKVQIISSSSQQQPQ